MLHMLQMLENSSQTMLWTGAESGQEFGETVK